MVATAVVYVVDAIGVTATDETAASRADGAVIILNLSVLRFMDNTGSATGVKILVMGG